MVHYYVTDFNSNLTVRFSDRYLNLIMPKQMLDEADGLLVEDFPKEKQLEIDID